MSLPRSRQADVGLLLEGTYPYVSGGVASWVHQMIRGFPELTFSLCFIGSRPQDYGRPKYEVPPNVVHAEAHYLFGDEAPHEIERLRGDPELFDRVEQLHEYLHAPEAFGADAHLLAEMGSELGQALDERQFLHSEEAWRFICRQFKRFSTDPSFVDYFWTVRAMHAPLFRLARARDSLPEVRVLHTISTGYAGYLGVLAKQKYGRPLVLSEHGMYTMERKIDLFAAKWIADNRSVFQRDTTEIAYFRQMWIRFFEALGKACYDQADQITALFESNRQRQIEDGAAPEKTCNVPNGVPVERYAPLRALRPADPPPVLCLIGRVVPTKDVKTFIRAMRSVVNRMPRAEGWIAGPEDEDRAYAEECRALAAGLGLGERVRFLGFQNLVELLPKIGLVVLSSISEGLPLAVLEGFAAGVPAVCTDVGSCRQLIEGLDPEDRALGVAGRIVRVADPQGLAETAVSLLVDRDAWHAAAQAGIRRVERDYSERLMLDRYRGVYERAFETAPRAARRVGG
jgi:glycosyltransferase involved in cell wall biosynthesis